MKGRLKKINIAGTWHIEASVELHGESINETGNYLLEVCDEVQKAAKRVAHRDKHKVNLKKVTVVVKTAK